MKWRGRRSSRNISDRRSGSGSGGGRGGGLGGLGSILRGGRAAPQGRSRGRVTRRRGGIGLIGIVVLLVGMYFGLDLAPFLTAMQGGDGGGMVPAPREAGQSPAGPNTIDDETEEFVAVVLADTEEVWTAEFARHDAAYAEPTLVLFAGQVRSACGFASAASGPFYCPADRQIYLDTDFFRTLERQLGARGDFARAYVIAHEVAHHVQNLMGVMAETARARRGASAAEANAISVMVELQADCLAGLWAQRAERRFGSLEPGDIEEAMNAAAQIGDDALQRRSQGHVVPDSFTHGSSAQRQRWFAAGYRGAGIGACDTFSAERL
ncbi:KPN_02809 family neutral zinc metallopeptidase [Paralimibaculum aggregatum]|nr:neutral zinc metallopeptidase [Limibaculum sp. NKW23]